MLVGPYLSHPLTRNMKNAHSSNSTPSAPSYSPPFDGIFIQTPLGAGRRDHRRRGELRLMRRSWRGVAESTRSLLQLPACRHFYLNRVDLTRVATWRKLKRGAICRLKSKLNTSLGVGNRAVWKARGRGRAAAPHGRPYTRAFFDELWPLPAVAKCTRQRYILATVCSGTRGKRLDIFPVTNMIEDW